jgi:hypothetical protein
MCLKVSPLDRGEYRARTTTSFVIHDGPSKRKVQTGHYAVTSPEKRVTCHLACNSPERRFGPTSD